MTQLDLDVLGPWVESVAGADALVFSSGQWFFKPAVYRQGGQVIGCHHCHHSSESDDDPDHGFIKQLGFSYGYRTAVHTALKEVVAVPGFEGVSILRTFAPDHFENGLWDTRGTCLREEPMEMPATEMNQLMHAIEVSEFEKARANSKSSDDRMPGAPQESPTHRARIRLLDITEMAQLRPDGHPGPYRNFHPYDRESASKFQADCLHWCLPGPIDAWNEMLMESFLMQHTGTDG